MDIAPEWLDYLRWAATFIVAFYLIGLSKRLGRFGTAMMRFGDTLRVAKLSPRWTAGILAIASFDLIVLWPSGRDYAGAVQVTASAATYAAGWRFRRCLVPHIWVKGATLLFAAGVAVELAVLYVFLLISLGLTALGIGGLIVWTLLIPVAGVAIALRGPRFTGRGFATLGRVMARLADYPVLVGLAVGAIIFWIRAQLGN